MRGLWREMHKYKGLRGRVWTEQYFGSIFMSIVFLSPECHLPVR